MSHTASGTFDVKLTPDKDGSPFGDPNWGHLWIDKQFFGDLQGTSKGQMLSIRTATKGSAGYVAMERVEAELKGRSGTFYLQHSGTMSGGAQHLSLSVVPDSGSGQLLGLSGNMKIIIEDGKHRYSFAYSLPDPD